MPEYESIMEKLVTIKPIAIKLETDFDIRKFYDLAKMQGVNYYGANGYIDNACTKETYLIYDETLGVVPSDIPYDKHWCDEHTSKRCKNDYKIYTIQDIINEIKDHPELVVDKTIALKTDTEYVKQKYS